MAFYEGKIIASVPGGMKSGVLLGGQDTQVKDTDSLFKIGKKIVIKKMILRSGS